MIRTCRVGHRDDDRPRFICPMPDRWVTVHRRLVKAWKAARNPAIPEPPRPLILNGWAFSSDIEKEERWTATLSWATQHGLRRLIPTFKHTRHISASEGLTQGPQRPP